MPNGVEVFVSEGFAEISVPDRQKRAEVHRLILEHTPVRLIEKDSRKGKFVVYRIPEGNAREAGLLDEVRDEPLQYKQDMGYGQALVDADPKTTDKREGGVQHGEYGTILPTVADTAYQAMPTTGGNVHDGDLNFTEPQPNNGKIRAELRPNKPVVDAEAVPQPPAYASETASALQARIRANRPKPNDYAPTHVPREERVPVAQATIAATVDRAPQGPAEPLSGFGIGPNAGRVVEGQPGGEPGPTTVSRPDIITQQRTDAAGLDPQETSLDSTSPEPSPEPAKRAPAKKAPAKKAAAKKAPAKAVKPAAES